MNVRGIRGFDWDEGNSQKSWRKHHVSMAECEQVFYNEPLLIEDDLDHSAVELRCFALGKSDEQISFTVREGRIRVISARPMSRRERKDYEQAEADT